LYIGSLDSGETRRLMTIQSNVNYVPAKGGRPAAIVYVRDGTVVEQAFDGDKVTGEPSAVAENVEYVAASAFASFAVSANGDVLVFRPVVSGRTQLKWFDRSGKALGDLGPPGDYIQLRVSLDGTRVLYSGPDEQTGNRDVWYMET